MANNNIKFEMLEYYRMRSKHHDDYMSYTNHENFYKRQKEIINLIKPIIEQKKIIEIACGTGNWTSILANYGNEVLGVDSSLESLKIAKEKLIDYDNINLIKQNIFYMDKIDMRYEVAFAADFWSHLPKGDIDNFLSILNLLIAKDAAVIFTDMTYKDYFKNEKSYLDNDGNRIFTRTLPNDEREYKVVKNFPVKKELFSYFPNKKNIAYYEFPLIERWLLIYSNN